MSDVLGIDIGTSTIKLSRRTAGGEVSTERVARTPPEPLEILRSVDRLIHDTSAGVIALSSFRRALVVDEYTLVLARSSPSEPIVRPESSGKIDAMNPLAPIHRWVDSLHLRCPRFQTLDMWLAERLTGRSVCSESLAWLTGVWDTYRGVWDEAACIESLLRLDRLPEVISSPAVLGGVCLPVLGDHEATAIACAAAGDWPLYVAECGTALACMIGGGPEIPTRLGLESPVRCGYTELVDPYFEQRINGIACPAPKWMPGATFPAAGDVLIEALRNRGHSGGVIVLCGGNATQKLIEDLTSMGLNASIDHAYTSSAGALIMAERAVAGCMGGNDV